MTLHRVIGGRFTVVAELSKGGFGQTFIAEDLSHPDNIRCVIKQLKTSSDDPQLIDLAHRLFEQEALVLYKVGSHPQIPNLICHFEENGEFYLVQEYVEGNTFEQELAEGKIYTQSEVIDITRQLLEILAFVHQNDVIHRDIKPSNIIHRRSDGKIVLIDFGAVKQVRNQNPDTQTPAQNSIAIGSNGYMPMEQLAGHPRFSSDVYAAGMFAVQLLTQTHPTRFFQNQRTGEWVWQDKTSVNPHLAEVFKQMIRYDFRQRFPTAIETLQAFRRLESFSRTNAGKSNSNQDNQFPDRLNDNYLIDFQESKSSGEQAGFTRQMELNKTAYAPPPNLQLQPFQSEAIRPKQIYKQPLPQTKSRNPAMFFEESHSSNNNRQNPQIQPHLPVNYSIVRKLFLPPDADDENDLRNNIFVKIIFYLFLIGIILWFCSWLVFKSAQLGVY